MTPTRPLLIGCLIPLLGSVALAVGTSNWRHSSEADFKKGTFDQVVATNFGELKLSRAVKTLMEQDADVSTVNALAETPDGAIYAGTGPKGTLLRVKGETVGKVLTVDDATNLFSLLVDKEGRLLIGTGGEAGRVLRLDKPADAKPADEKPPTEIFKADGVQYIWAMTQTSDGTLYLATGPTGQLWEVKPNGDKRVLFDSDEHNLTALISDGRDSLYVGTDPNGLLYRVNRKTGDSFVLYDAPESEISGIVIDKEGNIFLSTAEAKEDALPAPAAPGAEPGGRPEGGANGVPIPSEQPKNPEPPKLPDPNPGRPNPIPKPPKAEPSASVAPGSTDAGFRDSEKRSIDGHRLTQPKTQSGSDLIRVHLCSSVEPRPASAERHPVSLDKPHTPKPGPAHPTTVPSAPPPAIPPVLPPEPGAVEPKPEGNAVYRIDHDGFVTEVFRHASMILGMVEREGKLILATGDEGEVFSIDPKSEENVVLAKVEPKQIMSLLSAKDGKVYLGTANVGQIAALTSGYATEGTYTSPVLDAAQISRFGKMHLQGTLGEGTSIMVSTRSGNLKNATEKGWSNWTEPVPAAEFLPITSPSARCLQYRLTLTSKTADRTPAVDQVDIAYQMPNLAPKVSAVHVQPVVEPPPAASLLAEAAVPATNQPPRNSGRFSLTWEAADPNNDPLQYTLYLRSGADGPWVVLKEKLAEPTFEWDARSVADGTYTIRVVASDSAANETGKGKTGSRVTDPIVVDNTPPAIGDLKQQQAGKDVKISFRAVDRTSVLAGAEYCVDSSKDWQTILPSDTIWDSPEETAVFTLSGLSPGAHQVSIRVSDARGNQAFQNVILSVKEQAAAK